MRRKVKCTHSLSLSLSSSFFSFLPSLYIIHPPYTFLFHFEQFPSFADPIFFFLSSSSFLFRISLPSSFPLFLLLLVLIPSFPSFLSCLRAAFCRWCRPI